MECFKNFFKQNSIFFREKILSTFFMSAGRHKNDLGKCVGPKIQKNGFLHKYKQFLQNLDWQSRNKWGFASMGAHICYFSIFSDSKSKVEISIFWNVGRPTFENESRFLDSFFRFSQRERKCSTNLHRGETRPASRSLKPYDIGNKVWRLFKKSLFLNFGFFEMSAGRHFKKPKFQLCF